MSGMSLSSTARRVLAVVRAEGLITSDDLGDLLGMAGPVVDDAIGELLAAGAIVVDVVGALEVLRCPDEDAA